MFNTSQNNNQTNIEQINFMIRIRNFLLIKYDFIFFNSSYHNFKSHF